jgi:hypothetical protein
MTVRDSAAPRSPSPLYPEGRGVGVRGGSVLVPPRSGGVRKYGRLITSRIPWIATMSHVWLRKAQRGLARPRGLDARPRIDSDGGGRVRGVRKRSFVSHGYEMTCAEAFVSVSSPRNECQKRPPVIATGCSKRNPSADRIGRVGVLSRAGVRTVAACSLYSHKAGDRPPPTHAKLSGGPSWKPCNNH